MSNISSCRGVTTVSSLRGFREPGIRPEARIELRIAQLHTLAAQMAVDWWRELTGANWP